MKGHQGPSSRLAALIILITALLLFTGCGQQAQQQFTDAAEEGRRQVEQLAGEASRASEGISGSSGQSRTVTVSSVTDGDTIEIEPAVNGKTDVRLIGVDTPETYGGEEPLGAEAKQFTTNSIEDRQVKLMLGQDPEDPYGRLLANVVPVGQQRMHAELLLERGLAQDLFYSPNTANEALFGQIQENAIQQQVGIWGLPLSQQCQLEDRGNGIGSGSPSC